MKKLFLMVAVMVIAASASFAQIGARIGMNFASLSHNDYFKSSIGLHIGGVYNLELADALSLQPGVFLSAKNLKATIDYIDVDDNGMPVSKEMKAKYHPTFIDIPVLVKYNLDLTSDISIDPHVGPYFAYGIGGKAKVNGEKYKFFGKDGFKRFDMGIQLGCGATFFDAVYAGLDYQIGFHDLVKDNGGDPQKFGNFMITFGVWIDK